MVKKYITSKDENSVDALDDITVYLCEPFIEMRREFRFALSHDGVTKIEDFHSASDLIETLSVSVPDVLVADADVGGDAASSKLADFIRLVRQCQSPIDPFFPVIFLSWQKDLRTIRQMAFAGVDDILVKPVSPKLIIQRIRHLIHKRKKFVITSDYVGPDRRSEERQKKQGQGLVQVPNRLLLKVNGTYNDTEYLQQVEAYRATIGNKRIERFAERVHLLSKVLEPVLVGGVLHKGTQPYNQLVEVRRLSMVLVEDVAKTDFSQSVELGQRLKKVVEKILQQHTAIPEKDAQLLYPMAQAVHRSVLPNLDEKELALNIASQVENYKKAHG